MKLTNAAVLLARRIECVICKCELYPDWPKYLEITGHNGNSAGRAKSICRQCSWKDKEYLLEQIKIQGRKTLNSAWAYAIRVDILHVEKSTE